MTLISELTRSEDESLQGGAYVTPEGVEFALYSRHATNVMLCLFDDVGVTETAHYRLHRHDDDIWRGRLPGAGAGLLYGYRVEGPFDPDKGHRFNAAKLLVDPFARRLSGGVHNNPALFAYEPGGSASDLGFSTIDSAPYVPKGIVVAPKAPGGGPKKPQTPYADSLIYELHVGGYTRRCPDVPERLRGSFAALSEPKLLDHMRAIGVTAVELMPVQPFNDEPHLWARGLQNYWGYNPYNFFAADPRYGDEDSFRAMVRRFHDAGIEVILDVVYNHTGEGDEHGPTLSLRGIDNASFYRLMPHHQRLYVNDTGCGNTLDLDQPYVREMVLASLRYWAGELEVDGFRFDLAPVLAREAGSYTQDAAFFRAVEADPELSGLKLIAEPWDIGPGGYRLGEFPLGWSEWNDQYRDTVRAFWRGNDSTLGALAERITGSRRVFGTGGRRPQASINYVAVHDGFTLEDVVSYDNKHNEANAEGNRDGHNNNLSRNWGVEGPSSDAIVRTLRGRLKRNMLATLFLSQGVPLIQGGDEFGRSQHGNNNGYCQNNEISWLDWQAADRDLAAFVGRLAEVRRRFPQLRRQGFPTGSALLKGEVGDLVWFSPEGRRMRPQDWQLHYARCLAFYLAPCETGTGEFVPPLLVMMNAHHEAIDFRLPRPVYGADWTCLVNTADVNNICAGIPAGNIVSLAARSLAVLSGSENKVAEQAEIDADRYDRIDLCRTLGIEEVYEDLSGVMHRLDDARAQKFLEQFGYDVSTPAAVDRQVRELLAGEWRQLVPPVTVLRYDADRPAAAAYRGECRLHVPEAMMRGQLRWSIAVEGGHALAGQLPIDALPLERSAKIGRRLVNELTLPLPPQLPLGYHQLTITIGEHQASSRLIVAPLHCYRPQWLRDHQRVFGIAHQLYSLKGTSDTGVGDLSDLVGLIDHGGRAGADVIGLNPLHALFPLRPGHASPYAPSSRLWLNTLFLDVTRIDGYASLASELAPLLAAPPARDGLVDYASVSERKYRAFRRLYQQFEKTAPESRRAAFTAFCLERGESLINFACFSALEWHFDGNMPWQWPAAYLDPKSEVVAAFRRDHEAEILFHAFLQWQADEQLRRAAEACEAAGMKVGLYGDLAVGVASDGADAWANPGIFMRSVSFGAPPDAFNSEGQNWCMPPMNPRLLAEAAYRPFVEMLRENMRHYGALRMDHVMWLQRMFIIPGGEHASAGTYLRFPFDDLLAILALESTRARCLVIGEDLGTVPLGFRERMEIETILSYKLMRFERYYDGSFKAPADYPYLALATPSSHDLPTLVGFLKGLDNDVKRQIGMIKTDEELAAAGVVRRDKILALIASLQREGMLDHATDWSRYEADASVLARLCDAVQVYLARSKAALMMVNLEDLARSPQQVNVPGTVEEVPNWRHRLDFAPARLADADLKRLFHDLAEARRSRAV